MYQQDQKKMLSATYLLSEAGENSHDSEQPRIRATTSLKLDGGEVAETKSSASGYGQGGLPHEHASRVALEPQRLLDLLIGEAEFDSCYRYSVRYKFFGQREKKLDQSQSD